MGVRGYVPFAVLLPFPIGSSSWVGEQGDGWVTVGHVTLLKVTVLRIGLPILRRAVAGPTLQGAVGESMYHLAPALARTLCTGARSPHGPPLCPLLSGRRGRWE